MRGTSALRHEFSTAHARAFRSSLLLRLFGSGLLLFSLSLRGVARGATVVDQEYVPTVPTSLYAVQARSDDYNGQSFTVGQWGILKRVEIWITKDLGVTNDMDWILFRFNGDLVEQPFLSGVIVPNTAIPTTVEPPILNMTVIDLSATTIVVKPGDYLGMLVHSQIPGSSRSGINWYGGWGASDGYPRGMRLQSLGIGGFGVSSNADQAFRTFVELAEPPVILNQPQSQFTGVGSNVTFQVLASGTPPPRFQWRIGGREISGATNTTLVISNVQPADVGSYTVEITNLFGKIISDPATLAFEPPAVPPPFQWVRQGGVAAGGSNYSQGEAVAVDVAGNCYVTGQFSGTASFGGTNLASIGRYDIYVAKYDSGGALQWVHQAGSTNSSGDAGTAIAVDKSGNCYVTGLFYSNANFGTTNLKSLGPRDVFVAKYDTQGALQWVRGAGGTDYNDGEGIALDAEGNIYVAGTFRGGITFGGINVTNSNFSVFLVKYDSTGSAQWVRTGASGQSFSIAVDESGNSFLSGGFFTDLDFGSTNLTNSSGFGDAFLAKFDSSGVLQWVQSARATQGAIGGQVALDQSGKCYWTGRFGRDVGSSVTLGTNTLQTSGGEDLFVARFDGAGMCEWARQAGGNDSDAGFGIAADSAANCYVTGSFANSATFGSIKLSGQGEDVFLAKYDSAGTIQWAQGAGGSGYDIGLSIAVDRGGNCYLTGSFQTNASFGDIVLTATNLADMFVAKLAAPSNAPPIARDDSLGTTQNTPVTMYLAKLLANDSDADGDLITITSISATSSQNGTVSTNLDMLTYVPEHDFVGIDSFTYAISDGRGGSALGTVHVTVADAGHESKNIVSITINPLNQHRTIEFAGIPGRVYTVQASPNVNGPWSNVGSISAGANGLFTFEDRTDPPPAQQFYRTLAQ